MIAQLMKRDPAIKALPYVVAGTLIAGLAIGKVGNEETRAAVLGTSSLAPFMLLANMMPSVQYAGSRHIAHLPVTVRAVYLSRVASMLLWIWVPTVLLNWFAEQRILMPTAGITTFVALLQQRVAIRNMRHSRWIYAGSLLAIIALLVTTISYWIHPEGEFILMAACAVGSICLFVRTLNTLPSTFLIAQTRTPPQSPGAPSVRVPLIYLAAYLFWLPVSFAQMAFSTGTMGLVFVAFWWLGAKPWSSWLYGLPMSRSRLLARMMLPVVAVCVAGYMAGAYLPWNRHLLPDGRLRFLNAVFICAMVMLLSLLAFVSDWHWFRRLPARVRPTMYAVAIGMLALAVTSDVLSLIWHGAPPVRGALQWLAGRLPGWRLYLALVPLPILYLAADKVFREMENTATVPPIIARLK